MSTQHKAALALAKDGCNIFPCRAGDKRPAISNWETQATTDIAQINSWWNENPDYNPAIACGPSDVWVVDIDPGAERMPEDFPSTRVHSTPRGGFHLVYRGEGPTTAGRLGQHIDTRGVGGYILAPGAVLANGRYEVCHSTELAPVPAELIQKLNVSRERHSASPDVELDTPLNMQRAIEWLRGAPPAIEGDSGDVRTYQTAAQVRDMGISEELCLELMRPWNSTCVPEWDDDELAEKVANAYRYGQNQEGAKAHTAPEQAFDGLDPKALLPANDADSGSPTENVIAAMPHTEDMAALDLGYRLGERARYVAAWDTWMLWDGKVWRRDQTLWVLDQARRVCRDNAQRADTASAQRALSRYSTAAAVEKMTRSDRRHASSDEVWDADPWLLNVKNGVVDLKTGGLLEHDPARLMTKMADASYEPDAHCPRWLQFLEDVTKGDRKLQRYLQIVAGYSIVGDTREHVLVFLWGAGGNGKSTFIETLQAVLGPYATVVPMDSLMSADHPQHPTDIAKLRGARMAVAVETEEGRTWAESKVKALTGGDRITARFMRQDFFEFDAQHTLIVLGNHKPGIRNLDDAIRRRFHIVPFSAQFAGEKADKGLKEKLLAERDGILAWAVAGCLGWQEIGLAMPPAVKRATAAYFDEENVLAQWIEDRCELAEDAWTASGDLFANYKQWAKEQEEKAGTQRTLVSRLKTLFPGIEECRKGNGHEKRVRGLAGIRLQSPIHHLGDEGGDDECF